jgi:hypothetical protein
MDMYVKSIALALACCTMIGMQSGSAAAAHAERCDDQGFTLDDGRWIESPNCDARIAARYSRRHHEGYTYAQLRNSPASMDEFCRGNPNIEFTTTCAPYND